MIPTSSSMQRFSLMAPQQPRKPSTMMITPMAIIRSMPGRDSSVIYRQEEVGDGESVYTDENSNMWQEKHLDCVEFRQLDS